MLTFRKVRLAALKSSLTAQNLTRTSQKLISRVWQLKKCDGVLASHNLVSKFSLENTQHQT